MRRQRLRTAIVEGAAPASSFARRHWLATSLTVGAVLVLLFVVSVFSFRSRNHVAVPPPSDNLQEIVVTGSPIPFTSPFWNVWAEHFASEPQFEPTPKLLKQERALVVVDLSLAPFDVQGVTHSEISKALQVWLGTEQNPDASLEILLLPDLSAFRLAPNQPALQALSVDWQKLRQAQRRGEIEIPGNPLGMLRAAHGQSPLDLGHLAFNIQTNDMVGQKSIGVAIWLNTGTGGRIPIDETTLTLCVVTRVTDNCAGNDGSRKRADFAFLAGSNPSPPDALLHFVELDEHTAIGVFSCNACSSPNAGRYYTWQLDGGLKGLSDKISRILIPDIQQAEAVGKDDNWAAYRGAGQALYRFLFTSAIDRQHAEDAARQFSAFIQSSSGNTRDGAGRPLNPPSLLSRVLPAHREDFFIIPLNMMVVPQRQSEGIYVGLRVNVNSALPNQTYYSAASCEKHWVMLMPPADSDLKLEREEVDAWVKSFVGWTPKAALYESLKTFGDWAQGNNADGSNAVDSPPEGAALVILSHQEGDKLFFDGTNKVPAVYSNDLSRPFGPGSVAILSACNAADPGSFDILKELNGNGVGAIIASPTSLITPVGGRFLKTLFAELGSPETNLQRARFLATQKLMQDPDVGPQGLSFTFFGNPSASVCAPSAPVTPAD